MNDPELYVSALSSVVVDIKDLLNRLKGSYEWREKETILDVGSGSGNVTVDVLLPILPPDATVVGLDVSEQMVKHANKFYSNSRVSYRLQDVSSDIMHNLSWKPETFDKVFSFYCLHLVPNLDLVAKNLYYLLKKGGHLTTHFCITSPFNTVREVLSKQSRWKKYLEDDDDMSICSMQSADDPCAYFSNFLREAGFQDISCQKEKFTYKFQSMEDVLKLCKSVTPFLTRVPLDQLDVYMKDVGQVMERINEVKVKENGEVDVTWLNMVATAKKRR